MTDAGRPRYKRVLLKLSGEALMSDRRTGIDPETLASIADEIVDVQKSGVEIAIVIGGGNIFRGVTAATEGIDRVAGDHMGMLAPVLTALRASERNCEIIFKATQVDGIYTSDPKKDPTAQRIPYVTYQRVLAERLQVMDAAAIDVARNSQIPIYLFSLAEKGNIRRALLGEPIGSLVSDEVPALAARG